MTQKKNFSKSLALSLALVLLFPVIAFVVSACGSKVYHKVTFYDEDKQTVLQYVKVQEGKAAKYTAELPTKQGNQTYNYVFKNWVDENGVLADLTDIQEDMSVYASYKQEYVEYMLTKPAQVTVRKGGSALANGDKLHYGDEIIITYTETAGKHMTAFKLNGDNIRNGTLYIVKGNVEIVYQELGEGEVPTPSTKYTVKFLGPTGTEVASQEVEKNGKATVPNYTSDTYNLLRWNFDFEQNISKNTTVNGFFAQKSDFIEGTSFSISGEGSDTVLQINVVKGSEIYQLIQNQLETTEDIPTSFELKYSGIDQTVSNNDKIEWGEISCSIDFRSETLDFGFWCGYFEDANVLSINVSGMVTGFDHIFLTQDVNGICGAYKKVYGIVDAYKIEGLAKDKIAGAELVADFDTLYDVGSAWTINFEKGSTLYNIMASEFGVADLPTTIGLTVSQSVSSALEEWQIKNYGHVDYIVTLKNEAMNIEFDFGCYSWVGNSHILTISSSSLGLGVSNMFILVDKGQTTHYIYTDLKNFELVDEMATINYIGLNGNVLETKRSRAGAYVPTLNMESDQSGYKLVGWTIGEAENSGTQILSSGINNFYALYVKESEVDGTTFTIRGNSDIWVNTNDQIECQMTADSTTYKYLSSVYGDSVPTTLTFVVTSSSWDADEKCERFYITVEGMDGVGENVRYYETENLIAIRQYSDTTFLGNTYFVTNENRFGDGVVFTGYKNIYSYNNTFKG